MYEPEEELPLLSSQIKINYDKRFIRIAQDFIEKFSLLAGASQSEMLQISVLIEESLVFIIDKFNDIKSAAHIQIYFKATVDKKISIEIEDIGPPIHESKIPSFDVANENSEAGLWYKVVRGIADKFSFVNRYGSGWLIQIEKSIENITFTSSGELDSEDAKARREATLGEKHTRWATCNDVPALVDLAYVTYRYSYLSDFYNEDLLKRHIDEKLHEFILVEHRRKVIGACAIKYSDAGHVSAEIGSAMISPAYRETTAVRFILRELNSYIEANPQNCDFFMSTVVTTHTLSQKAVFKIHNGFKPLMIFLNMYPRIEFIGINSKPGARGAALYVYHPNDKLKLKRLFLASSKHLPMISELITNTGNDIEFLAEFSEPENMESQISVSRIDSMKCAIISIETIGRNWFTALSKQIFSIFFSGIESVTVTVPTSGPLPPDMENMLEDLNLVFCGLSLKSLERIDLAYCLSNQTVNFEQIKLHDPVAQKLLTQVKQNYRRVFGM